MQWRLKNRKELANPSEKGNRAFNKYTDVKIQRGEDETQEQD